MSGFRRKPKRFEMAVWDGQTTGKHLHALVIGATTRRKGTVQIDYIESFPYDRNPFRGKIFHIAICALTQYGPKIGAKNMRIVDVCDKLARHCMPYGFTIESSFQWPYKSTRYTLTKPLVMTTKSSVMTPCAAEN